MGHFLMIICTPIAVPFEGKMNGRHKGRSGPEGQVADKLQLGDYSSSGDIQLPPGGQLDCVE